MNCFKVTGILLALAVLACNTHALDEAIKPALESTNYVLSPGDIIEIRVYQEDDLNTRLHIGKDGSTTFPLIGTIHTGGKTVEDVAAIIRDRLADGYLVNPQVTASVVEYTKHRFIVLGQVQKPGAYEIPSEGAVTLLQAIAMAGGYTRLANRSSVTVTRMISGKKTTSTFDAKRAASDAGSESFKILPEDTITVPERIF